MNSLEARARSAVTALCLGTLLVVLDRTMVIVALPTIGADLGMPQATRLVTLYLLAYGSFLLLSGRLSDLFGYRLVFGSGTLVFTTASLICSFAHSPGLLAIARAVQAMGAAVVTVVTPPAIGRFFPDPERRTKALGVSTAVYWIGLAAGPFIGGCLLSWGFNWHDLFLANIPIGMVVTILSLRLLPRDSGNEPRQRVDGGSALTLVASLLAGGYAITYATDVGWSSSQTILLLSAAGLLLAFYAYANGRASTPLIPLHVLRQKSFVVASAAGALTAPTFYLSFLVYPEYLQLVLGYTPLKIATMLLPLTILPAVIGLGPASILISRWGVRAAIAAGLVLIGVGLLLLSRIPVAGRVGVDVLPSMLLIGAGFGVAPIPLLLAALGRIAPSNTGLASGMYATSAAVGNWMGVTVLTAISSTYTQRLLNSGVSAPAALNGGYHVMSFVGLLLIAAATTLSLLLPRHAEHR